MLIAFWSAACSRLLLAAPTPTPPYLSGDEAVGMNNALFYLLFFIGAVLFLLAFLYGRRRGQG